MGINNADIKKEDDEYVWSGDKNLSVYEQEFEKYLLTRVSFFDSLLTIKLEQR